MLDSVLLLFFLTFAPILCADNDVASRLPRSIQYPLLRRNFASHFQFSDHEDYDSNLKLVAQQVDRSHYYDVTWRTLEHKAIFTLKKRGRIVSPSGLHEHPNFINFFDGTSHTPALYVRVAEMLPNNPMDVNNPDVAILMHRVGRSYQTVVLPWLEVKAIIRGVPVDSTPSEQLAYQLVWERTGHRGRTVWLNQLSEVFKYPVLPDLERFGYNPTTIEDEISEYNRVRAFDYYSKIPYNEFRKLLTETRGYLTQFDMPYGDEYFNTYSLVFSPVIGSAGSEPWFQAPLFRVYNKEKEKAILEKYDFRGQQFPALDRVQYKVTRNIHGRSVLDPVAIVRPVAAAPTIKFETIYSILPRHARAGKTVLDHIHAPTVRLVPDPPDSRAKESLTGPRGFMFGQSRPFGHPLHYIASRQLDQIGLPSSSARALEASNDDPVDSSTQEQRATPKLAASEIHYGSASPPTQDQLDSSEPVESQPSTAAVDFAAEQHVPSELSVPESERSALASQRISLSGLDERTPKTPRLLFEIPSSPLPETPVSNTPKLLQIKKPTAPDRIRDEITSLYAPQVKSLSAADDGGQSQKLEERPSDVPPKIETTVDETRSLDRPSPLRRPGNKRPPTRFGTLARIVDRQNDGASTSSAQVNEDLKSHFKHEGAAASAQVEAGLGKNLDKHALPWTVQHYRIRPGPWPVRVSEYLRHGSSPYKRPRKDALEALQDHMNPALDDAFGHVKAVNLWRDIRP